MKQICVYTCITGTYDNLKELNKKEKNMDYYCFTNNKNITSNTWKVIYLEDETLDNIKLARKIKILGHPILDKYDITIWLDGTINVIDDLNDFVKQLDNDIDMVGFTHRFRNCIYKEAEECIKVGKGNKEDIEKEINFIKSKKYPSNNGLIESAVLLRKNNNSNLKKTMDDWFNMILKFSNRDQLAFNYVAWKNNLKVKYLKFSVFDNKWFKYEEHKNVEKYNKFIFFVDFGEGYQTIDKNTKYSYVNDTYIISFDVPKKAKVIRFDPIDSENFYFSKLDISTTEKIDVELINIIEISDKLISINDDPQVVIQNNDYKTLKIVISMEKITTSDVISIVSNNKQLEINKLLNELNIIKNNKGYKIVEKLKKIIK